VTWKTEFWWRWNGVELSGRLVEVAVFGAGATDWRIGIQEWSNVVRV
jgi:hypothetical protein